MVKSIGRVLRDRSIDDVDSLAEGERPWRSVVVRVLASVNCISVLFREPLSEAIAVTTIPRQRGEREGEREAFSLSEISLAFCLRELSLAGNRDSRALAGRRSFLMRIGRVHAHTLSTYVYYPGWSAHRLSGVERRGEGLREGYMYTRMSRYVQVQNA